MNQQQNTLVAYMTCKNLRCASSNASVSQSVSLFVIQNPFRFKRARASLSPSSASRYARSSSHRCSTLHAGVKRRLERDEPERRQYKSHFHFSASPGVRVELCGTCALSRTRVCNNQSNTPSQRVERTSERTNEATMGAEGKRRLLTLDDITPRLRGATGRENANGNENNARTRMEWISFVKLRRVTRE